MARVLVVDDAAFMRKMVSDALVKAGHEVIAEAEPLPADEPVEEVPQAEPEIPTESKEV